MSRYLLLLLLNTPLVIAAILGAITRYKLQRLTMRQLVVQLLFWSMIFIGLAVAEYVYEWLFSLNLTKTEPLSLFDVVQISGIITLLFIVNRLRTKVDAASRRVELLHQEISIRFSKIGKDQSKKT